MKLRWLAVVALMVFACAGPEATRPAEPAAPARLPRATEAPAPPATAPPVAVPHGGGPADAAASDDRAAAHGADAPVQADAGAQPDAGAMQTNATQASSSTGCPPSLEGAKGGPCALGTHCAYGATQCLCDGYHGGIPPSPGVDYSHWSCGRTKKRADGCPDDLRHGLSCTGEGRRCAAREGVFCGPTFECRGKRWISSVDTCSTLPRAPPRR